MKRIFMILALVLMLLAGAGNSAIADDDENRVIGLVTMDQVLEHDVEYKHRMIVYEPDAEAVAVIAAIQRPITIKLFYRNDCPDSIREVPRMFKALKEADNPNITLEIVGINYNKDKPADLLKGWQIEYVPTFIVLEKGKEIGRIVEEPLVSVEDDLAMILKE